MNIFEEWIFNDTDNKYDIWVLLGFQSLYQVLTITSLFWMDILPSFGASNDIMEWVESMKGGFQCVFSPDSLNFTAPVNASAMYGYNHCYNSALFGVLFLIGYMVSYVFGACLLRASSANFGGIMTSIGSPIVICIWFAAPDIEKWQCGSEASNDVMTLVLSFFSLGPMVGGAILFRWGEEKVENGDQNNGATYEVSLKLT